MLSWVTSNSSLVEPSERVFTVNIGQKTVSKKGFSSECNAHVNESGIVSLSLCLSKKNREQILKLLNLQK